MLADNQVVQIGGGRLGGMVSDPYDCNVYAVRCGTKWLIVDAGAGVDPAPVAVNLRRAGIMPGDVEALFLTHAHFDHSGGAAWMAEHLICNITAPGLSAAVLETCHEEAIHLPLFRRLGFYPAGARLRPIRVARRASGGSCWNVGDVMIRVVATPGHSRDSVSYLIETAAGLLAFVGDVVFDGGRVLLSPLTECEPYALGQSIRELARWPIDGLYPGHGPPTPTQGIVPIREAISSLDRMVIPPNLL